MLTSRWLEQTFTTKEKVDELLRPEVDGGELTPDDFERARAFLPGRHRYWHHAGYSVSFAVTCYGTFYRRPPWTFRRSVVMAGTTGVAGTFLGLSMKAAAYALFSSSLENPQGLVHALEHVYEKNDGGLAAVRHGRRRAAEGSIGGDPFERDDRQGHQKETGPSTMQQDTDSSVQETDEGSPTPHSRWDELRGAHVKGAQRSSWDTLRQVQEKARLQNTGTVQRQASNTMENDDRASEQAKFDEMLEAERKIAEGR